MPNIRLCVFSLLFFATLCSAAPWDTPFARDVAAISSAARAISVPNDPPVIRLLEQHSYVVDRQGRISSSVRRVYLVRRQEGVDGWSSIEQEYQPWHERRPEIRARTINSANVVLNFDPATIAEAPANQYDSTIYSDRRVVRAPLPGVEAGAVVEVEIVSAESRMQLEAGSVRRVFIDEQTPIERFLFSVEAPRQIPLRAAVHGLASESLVRSDSDKSASVRLELGPLAASADMEFDVAPDNSATKFVSFSTGQSWGALASSYAQVVDEKIEGVDLSDFLRTIDLSGPRQEVLTGIVSQLHRRVRYTGVEFAEAEIIPGTPSQTLARGYGDCKDKSTLLTALLRAAGFPAYVALLSAGFEPDVDPSTPGLGVFNHVIVFVDSEPPLWIDATAADARVGSFPLMDEGRLALVARRETTDLVPTPTSSSQDNWLSRTSVISMSDFGHGSYRETIRAGGSIESAIRSQFAADPVSAREVTASNVERTEQGKLASLETSERFDFSAPFEVSLAVEQSHAVTTTMNDAVAIVNRADIFSRLPYTITSGLFASTRDDEERRTADVWIREPYHVEISYKVIPPPLFKAVSLLESVELSLGPAVYAQSAQTLDDGAIAVRFEFDSGNRRWSPEDVEQFQQAAKPYFASGPAIIRFLPVGVELNALGQAAEAIQQLRDYVDEHPDDSASRAHFSRALASAGLGSAARREARLAVETSPSSVPAWLASGQALQLDGFGRRFAGAWNREQAIAAIRKAVELDSSSPLTTVELADLLQHDSRGVRFGPGAETAEAISLYEQIVNKQPAPQFQVSLLQALIRAGRLNEAENRFQALGSQTPNPFSWLIKALRSGVASIAIDAQAAFPNPANRAQALSATALSLLQMRRYDLAAPLFQAADRIQSATGQQQLSQLLERVRRYETAAPAEDDPLYPAWQVLVGILCESVPESELKQWFTDRADWSGWASEISALRARLLRSRVQAKGLARSAFNDDGLADVILGAANFDREGDEQHGFRIRGSGLPTFLVIREQGQYRILSTSYNLAEVGKLVWTLVDAGSIEAARWWLDQAIPTSQSDGSGEISVAAPLWSGVTEELRDANAARAAAAALVGRSENSDRAVSILRNGASGNIPSVVAVQAKIALAAAFQANQRWEELRELAPSIGEAKLYAREAFRYSTAAARGGRDWDDYSLLAKMRLDAVPNDSDALQASAEAYAHLGDVESFETTVSRILTRDYVVLDDLMFAAWMRHLLGTTSPNDLTALRDKVAHSPEQQFEFYFTQAMLEIDSGQLDQAIQSLRLAVGEQDTSQLGPKAWYVQSLIYDRLGLAEDAKSAQQRARSAAAKDAIDSWALAVMDSSRESSSTPR